MLAHAVAAGCAAPRPAVARAAPRRSLPAPTGRASFARAPNALSDAAPSSSRAAEEAAAFAQAPPGPPKKGRPLRASDFRHPLDQQNTQLLEAIPGISALTKSLVTPVAERMLVLEQISTSVLVGPEQLPHVHQMVLDAAAALDVEPPQLYIRQNPTPNAYTLAISGRAPVVVVHSALVDLMDAAELQAVIAHELGHLKCDHGVWLTVANLLSLGIEISPLVPQFVVSNVQDELLRWSRAAELTCDRAALIVAGDPKVVVSVLMKLSGGSPKLANMLNVDAFLDQARSYDEQSATPLGSFLRNAQTRQLTHPLPVARAREIDLWARSADVLKLKRSGVFSPAPSEAREKHEAAARASLAASATGFQSGVFVSRGGSSGDEGDARSPATSYDEM